CSRLTEASSHRYDAYMLIGCVQLGQAVEGGIGAAIVDEEELVTPRARLQYIGELAVEFDDTLLFVQNWNHDGDRNRDLGWSGLLVCRSLGQRVHRSIIGPALDVTMPIGLYSVVSTLAHRVLSLDL